VLGLSVNFSPTPFSCPSSDCESVRTAHDSFALSLYLADYHHQQHPGPEPPPPDDWWATADHRAAPPRFRVPNPSFHPKEDPDIDYATRARIARGRSASACMARACQPAEICTAP
jgi:hypothetical protein